MIDLSSGRDGRPTGIHPFRVVLAAIALLATPAGTAGVLEDTLSPPPGLTLSGGVRARVDHLAGDFRADPDALNDLLNVRTNVRAEWRSGPISAAVEIMDSRAFLHDDDDRVGTAIVNVLEPIDAWVAFDLPTGDGPELRLRAGRISQDLGSRRLVARNRYRNTVNTFDGVDLVARFDRAQVRLLYYLPIDRRPAEGERIGDHDFELDESDPEQWLAGLWSTFEGAPGGQRLELYVLHLDEADAGEFPTANRRLTTPGFRWTRAAAPGEFDFEIEGAVQFGERRATAAAGDIDDLDVSAHFWHVEVGHTFATEARPRLALIWDHASGDEDPADGDLERFDGLFGAPAKDFGPTGIYRPFDRANIDQLVAQLSARPVAGVSLRLRARLARLDERSDAWARSGYRDPTGRSGDELGSVMEAQANWWVIPERVQLEIGASLFDPGDYARDVPGSEVDDRVVLSWIAVRAPL